MNNDVLANADTSLVRKRIILISMRMIFMIMISVHYISSYYIIGKSLFSNREAIYGVYPQLTKRLDFDEIR